MNETNKKAINDLNYLNHLVLLAIYDLASDGTDESESVLICQFGITKKTASALRNYSTEDIKSIAEQLGDVFIFAKNRYDDILYNLCRNGVPAKDHIVMARLACINSMNKGN